jgi:hypothetical protein
VWVVLHRLGRATAGQLAAELVLDAESLETALEVLRRDGRIERIVAEGGAEGDAVYQTATLVVPIGATVGWEAAVFDHFQAMVAAIVRKLDGGESRARHDDRIGGSTYHFDVWPGHPHAADVESLFQRLRGELSTLRASVSRYSEAHAPPSGEGVARFTLYLGQLVREDMAWVPSKQGNG